MLVQPDWTFQKFRGRKSGDRLALCSLGNLFDRFWSLKVVKMFGRERLSQVRKAPRALALRGGERKYNLWKGKRGRKRKRPRNLRRRRICELFFCLQKSGDYRLTFEWSMLITLLDGKYLPLLQYYGKRRKQLAIFCWILISHHSSRIGSMEGCGSIDGSLHDRPFCNRCARNMLLKFEEQAQIVNVMHSTRQMSALNVA